METPHPLDRPVWNALSTRQADVSRGDPRTALQFDPDYGPFGAMADASPEALAALAALDFGRDGLWLNETGETPAPPGLDMEMAGVLHQMVAPAITPAPPPAFAIVPLTDADGPEMLALATLTKPGPFFQRTHRLGRFVGVRENGRLVAMAGERMRPVGFTEVSGVCTHPDHRGRGYAAALMREVANRIVAEGETPFLHVRAANTGAIGVYETLGFVLRRKMNLIRLTRRAVAA